MILSKESVADLVSRGWVRVEREAFGRLERVGAPMVLPIADRSRGTYQPTPMTPGWVVGVIESWPSLDLPSYDLLSRVIAAAHRRNDPELAEACVAVARLSGADAVIKLLEDR